MPILNLQLILNGDDVSTMTEKINNNFKLLMSVGGGPQGKKGPQGTPGLPGLRGLQGFSGDNGKDGQQVTLIQDDPNWGVEYKGVPGTQASADSAVNDFGYNVGDVWIDNIAGMFYTIKEPDLGEYIFEPHPISPSVLELDEKWVNDTTYDVDADSNLSGIRLSNRFATVSISSTKSNADNTPLGESAKYNQFISSGNISVGSYKRPAYKLSLDHDNYKGVNMSLHRVSGKDSNDNETHIDGDILTNRFIFNISDDKYAPLILLDSTRQDDDYSDTAFGILHSMITSSGLEEVPHLAIRNENENSIITYETAVISQLGRDNMFIPKNTDDNVKMLSFIDVMPDGSIQETPRSLWFTMSTVNDNYMLPVGQNKPEPTIGMRINSVLKQTGNNDYLKGKIEFYVHDRLMGPNRVVDYTDDLGLRLCKNTSWNTKGVTIGQDYEDEYIENGLVVQGNTTIGTEAEFDIDTFQYSNPLKDIIEKSRLTIEQENGIFSFSASTEHKYSVTHTIDDDAARIQTNSEKHGLILGSEGIIDEDTDFKGRHLYIQPGGNIGLGIYGDPTDYPNIVNQRLVIRKNKSLQKQGLQILGYNQESGPDNGFQIRTDKDGNAEIYQSSSRSISWWTDGIKHMIMSPDGGTKLSKGEIKGDVSGNATFEILGDLNGIDNEVDTNPSITFGLLRKESTTDNINLPVEFKNAVGIMYQGFNAWYKDGQNGPEFSYRGNPGDTDNTNTKGAGNMIFNTSRGTYHITSYGDDDNKIKKYNAGITSIPSF